MFAKHQLLCTSLFDEVEELGVVDKPGGGDDGDFAVGELKFVLALNEELSEFGKRHQVNPEFDQCFDIKPVDIFIDLNGDIRLADVVDLSVESVFLDDFYVVLPQVVFVVSQPLKGLGFG